jgi:hypothetical protein
MMLIYLCTDELNRALVRGWARKRGLDVDCPTRTDRATSVASGLLIDVDHLPPGALDDLLARFRARHGLRRVAAHGFGVAPDALRARDIPVHPRLDREVLRGLAAAAAAAEAPVSCDSDELTWIALD